MSTTLNYVERGTRTLTVGTVYTDGKPTATTGRTLTDSKTLASTTANAVAGGADLVYSEVITLTASGTSTLNLQSFTDALGRTAQSFTRVKSIEIKLLTTTDTFGTITGTAASSISIGNAGSDPVALFLDDATTTFSLKNGENIKVESLGAAGWTVDGTHKNILFTNIDGVVGAKVLVQIIGGST